MTFKCSASYERKRCCTRGFSSDVLGTLRLMVVLLNDFPEFLCEHHVVLTESLPFNSIQLRNLILSAFPRNTKLPDPSLPNLKVFLFLSCVFFQTQRDVRCRLCAIG